MRRRLYPVIAAAALAMALPSSADGPAKLDGDKVKKVEAKAMAELQSHDEEQVLEGADRMKCAPPRCMRLDFVFSPVTGASGDVVVQATWGNRLTDVDLYLIDSANADVAHCAFTGGTREAFAVASDKLKKGEKYTVVADFFRSVGEEVTTTVEFPATYTSSGVTGEEILDCAL